MIKNLLYSFVLLSFYSSIKASDEKLICDFTHENNCLDNVIQFSDLSFSESNIITWLWDFGDNNTSIDQNPVHAYRYAGKYNVLLVTKSESGLIDSIRKTIEINGLPYPYFLPDYTCSEMVLFQDHSLSEDGELIQWEWKFGNIEKSSAQYPAVNFKNKPGNHHINLTVTNEFGCSDSLGKNLKIMPTPQSGFNISSIRYGSNTTIGLTNSCVGANELIWDLGDGEIQESATNIDFMYHTYTGRHNFIVKQVALNNFGCVDTTKKEINVSQSILNIPTSISPNGDGIDDYLSIKPKEDSKYRMEIYDVMGRAIYISSSSLIWNGRIYNNGPDARPGVYIYNIEETDDKGLKIMHSGTIVLQR